MWLRLLRVHHWSKNVLIIFGAILAILNQNVFNLDLLITILFLTLGICFISSGNYVLNDISDRAGDRLHPLKKNRVIASSAISINDSYMYMVLFWGLGFLLIIFFVRDLMGFLGGLAVLLNGIMYNVRPIRLKDVVYVDVFVESVNSVVRFLVGWLIVIREIPSFTLMMFVFLYTAVLMFSKRLAELSYLKEKKAVQYRGVFNYYSIVILTKIVILSIVLTAISLFLLVEKSRLAWIMVPLVTLQLLWYYYLSRKGDLSVQKPVYIFRHKLLFVYSLIVFFIGAILVLKWMGLP
ncbi:UbiA family prenyltransferase [Nanoarchaeota archaeon]